MLKRVRLSKLIAISAAANCNKTDNIRAAFMNILVEFSYKSRKNFNASEKMAEDGLRFYNKTDRSLYWLKIIDSRFLFGILLKINKNLVFFQH